MRRIMSLLTITFQELKMIHVTTDVFITQVAAIFSQESFRTPENGSISRPVWVNNAQTATIAKHWLA